MMRKRDVDEYARKRPFQPFELRMVDGQRYSFAHPEEFLVASDYVITLNRQHRAVWISIGLITTIGPVTRQGRRRPRKKQ